MREMIFTAILCVVSNFLQADLVQTKSPTRFLLNTIIDQEKEFVRGYENNADNCKIYIRSEKIIATDHGLYISLNNNELLPLPLLFSNTKGCFLIADLINCNISCARQSRGACPNCDTPTDSKGICRNPDCFFYGVRVIE